MLHSMGVGDDDIRTKQLAGYRVHVFPYIHPFEVVVHNAVSCVKYLPIRNSGPIGLIRTVRGWFCYFTVASSSTGFFTACSQAI